MVSPYFGSFLIREMLPTGEVGWADLGDAMWLSAVARDDGESPLTQLSTGTEIAANAVRETRRIAEALSPFSPATETSGRSAQATPLAVALIGGGRGSRGGWAPTTVPRRGPVQRRGAFD